jgi:hypothetical protein
MDPGLDVPDERYSPYNCILENGTIGGTLDVDGNCAGVNHLPPCIEGGCLGWTQIVGDCAEDDAICECDGINCPCDCQVDPLSCGTIVLVDGSCWECCREEFDIETIGGCCVSDGYGDYVCLPLTETTCLENNGYFSTETCYTLDCSFGACCYGDACQNNVVPDTCHANGGVWIGGNCVSGICNSYKNRSDFKEEEIIDSPSLSSITQLETNNKTSKIISTKTNRIRKPIDSPIASLSCDGIFSLSSCVEPGIIIPPENDNPWIIEVGSGKCSCCCPDVCWEGALGDGGIVNDCSEIDKRCQPVFGCFEDFCYQTSNSPSSVPDGVSVCEIRDENWTENEHKCKPYVDNSNPENPVWMVCSCCCKESCIEYKEPRPCSECENKSTNCVCVNGCDNCFYPK